MRKLFLFLLILISLWIWSLDLVDILFYYFRQHYTTITGNSFALIIFCPLVYFFSLLFSKYFGLEKKDIRITQSQLKEFAVLLCFFLPVLIINYQRIMFPDKSFDVQAYHIFLHRLNRFDNLRNFNLVGGAGGGTYFFTLSYKIFGFFREALGYRMGTIFNTFLLFLVYVSVYDFLKKFLDLFFPEKKIALFLIALSALLVIYSDNTLFMLNSYNVDMIGVPLLLELIHLLFFRPLDDKNKNTITLFFFVITSILIAYKLTYLPYVVIIGIGFIIRNYKIFLSNKILILFCLIALVFPSIYLIYNYTETLNPIFPFYNKFFKSPLYEIKNFKDTRWGPRSIYEMFVYNIICLLHPERNSEWGFISIRLLAEYLIIAVSAGILIYNKFSIKNKKTAFILYLSLVAILCNYILLATTGYYRYGILIEVLFGIILIVWLYYLFFLKQWIVFASLLILMIIQSINTYNRIFLLQSNLSWYNYKELRLSNSGLLKAETKKLFHDYDPEIEQTMSNLQISAFLSSECNGVIKLIAPETPIYNILSFSKRQPVIDSFQKNIIDTLSQKHNFYVMTTMDNLFQKIDEVNKQNYYVDSIVDIYPSFSLTNMPFYLLKIKHFDKGFNITNRKSMLRVDSSGYSPHFFYNTQGKFKSYIIGDPYTYNWPDSPDSAKFTVNGNLYNLNTAGNKNKIVTTQNISQLSFINYNNLHYFIIIQKLQAEDSLKAK
jgi:hypothetical protein